MTPKTAKGSCQVLEFKTKRALKAPRRGGSGSTVEIRRGELELAKRLVTAPAVERKGSSHRIQMPGTEKGVEQAGKSDTIFIDPGERLLAHGSLASPTIHE